jgi:hypothetical protein
VEKKFDVIPFDLSTNFTKLYIILVLKCLRKKFYQIFKEFKELFTQKIVTKLRKVCVWDPGSEIWHAGSGKNLIRIPDPGVKKASDPGSESATLLGYSSTTYFIISRSFFFPKDIPAKSPSLGKK